MTRAPEPWRAVFVVPPGAHLLDVCGPAHIFYEAAEYGAPVTSHFVGIEQGISSTRSSSGLGFTYLQDFASFELTPGDIVFVPGLEAKTLFDPGFLPAVRPFLEWLEQQHCNGASTSSVCTGAFLIAECGIFDGRECTTHWKYFDRFRQRYPEALLRRDRLFVDADIVYSSAGVASGIDLAFYLLEKKMGSLFTAKVAREVVVYLRRTDADPQLSVFLKYRDHIEDRIHRVQDLLAQSLADKLTIDDLAERVNVSPRNLTRLFKKTTHITIGQYLDKLRLERATQLIANGHKISAVAAECGLASPNQLRNLLRRYRNVLPSDIRAMS